MSDFLYAIGDDVTEAATGFRGRVVRQIPYNSHAGCRRYVVQPAVGEERTIDEDLLRASVD